MIIVQFSDSFCAQFAEYLQIVTMLKVVGYNVKVLQHHICIENFTWQPCSFYIVILILMKVAFFMAKICYN
jgi:hypothetical protein